MHGTNFIKKALYVQGFSVYQADIPYIHNILYTINQAQANRHTELIGTNRLRLKRNSCWYAIHRQPSFRKTPAAAWECMGEYRAIKKKSTIDSIGIILFMENEFIV